MTGKVADKKRLAMLAKALCEAHDWVSAVGALTTEHYAELEKKLPGEGVKLLTVQLLQRALDEAREDYDECDRAS